MSDTPAGQPQPPQFDPDAPHQQKPLLRGLRAFPLQAKGPDGQPMTMLGLADAQQISDRIVATLPAAQLVLPHLNGEKGLDEIVTVVGKGLTLEFLQQFVAQLDDAGLIYGPKFEAMVVKMREDFDSSDTLPPGATAQVAEQIAAQKLGEGHTEEQRAEAAPGAFAEMMDKWIAESLKEAEDPAFDALPKAVVAPHIDYGRGWHNYAQIWGRLRTTDRPDRVVILGTNHFGQSTGVCGCDKGYQSPFGTSPVDEALIASLRSKLGEDDAEKLFANRYDHEREHSIELHIPWIQHCLGAGDDGSHVPVFAALIHDPTVNNGESYDGNGLGMEPFLTALRAALDEVGGTTLVVSSADLSHVGPAFGDATALAGETDESKSERERVVAHDRDMLRMVSENKPEDLIASMSWQQNPTRWCSIGNMTAAMRLTEPSEVKLLSYQAAIDQQGTTMVSHAAVVMV